MNSILSFFVGEKVLYGAFKQGESVYEDKLSIQDSSQSEALVPFLSRLWQKANNTPLTHIICPRGPASYTTIRISLSAAQGLKTAFPKAHIFAPSHFKVLAFASGLKQGTVLIDSQKGFYYGASFDNLKLDPPQVWEEDAIENRPETFIVSSRPDYFRSKFKGNFVAPNSNLALCQIDLFELEKSHLQPEEKTLSPLYIQNPVYRKKKQSMPEFLALREKLKFKLELS